MEKAFFDKLSPKLNQIKEGIYYVTGMFNDTTVELILTAEGKPKTVVFVEELIAAAPVLNGWKFTALKPALDIKGHNHKHGRLRVCCRQYLVPCK